MNASTKLSIEQESSIPLAGGIEGGLPKDGPSVDGPTPPACGRGEEGVSAEQQAIVDGLGEKIVAQLRTVFDPEIPVNIYDLGLIYTIDVKPADCGKHDVKIDMTLTTPNCPVAGEMPAQVQMAVLKLDEINDAHISLVWDPPWDRSRMSDEAMLHLNMF